MLHRHPRPLAALAAAALVALALARAPRTALDEPAVLVESGPTATLRFEIQGEDGAPMPGRLTFVAEDGGTPAVFTRTDARPDDLAVRKNVVYSLSGRGAIGVPPGSWTVHVTRGLEWSRSTFELRLEADQEHEFVATLQREVDTSGWIGGDFHLHTLTHSGHGDADLKERVISLAGEGVEFAVATDHNHNTDYRPTVAELGAEGHFTSVVGNEVSTPIGHFNAFPLDPASPVPDPQATDANALFRIIRGETNEHGVPPLIQVNHPRWREIDYFTLAGLDPVDGSPSRTTWSAGFDTLEIFNANAGWGYYDADVEQDFSVGASVHWVLSDWFNLLNRGMRTFAVGNSDSHTVHHEFAGYPRNFVQCSAGDPGAIDVAEVVEAVRAGRVFTTTGPFVDFRVLGQPSGSLVTQPETDPVVIDVRVQSASWIKIDRIKVFVNGVLFYEKEPQRIEDSLVEEPWTGLRLRYAPGVDCWITATVEGDQPLDPVVTGAERPILPLAVTNPVWVDGDRDGSWTSPWDQALTLVRENPTQRGVRLKGLLRRNDEEVSRVILACAQEGLEFTPLFARQALQNSSRRLQLVGARAAERVPDPALLPDLERALRAAADPYVAIGMLRAHRACGGAPDAAAIAGLFERFGRARVMRYGDELQELLPGAPVTQWQTIGYFGEAGAPALLDTPFGPEAAGAADEPHLGRGGAELAWSRAEAGADGYLDLRAIDPDQSENCVAFARTFLFTAEPRAVWCALGTDDGALVWLNRELVNEDRGSHAAAPLQHLVRMDLRAGWNEVLFKVVNGSGGFGLRFRPLDFDLRVSAQPE